MGPAEAIRDLALPSLVEAGLELWDVEITADTVRVLVDRPGGVDLDALSAASAALSPLLDEHPEVIPLETYQLEVSSPGLERTLRTPEQYLRYVGQPVAVKTTAPVAGSRRLQGTLTDVEPNGIRMTIEGAPGADPVPVPFEVIARARTVLIWGATAKPGRPSRSPQTSITTKDVT